MVIVSKPPPLMECPPSFAGREKCDSSSPHSYERQAITPKVLLRGANFVKFVTKQNTIICLLSSFYVAEQYSSSKILKKETLVTPS